MVVSEESFNAVMYFLSVLVRNPATYCVIIASHISLIL